MNIFTKYMRTLLAVTAAVAVGAFLLVGCGDNGSNPGGNGGDGGEGGSYESVVIGGKRWMKKNLDVSVTDSWCYGNSADSCAKYGRLYTWQAAKSACQSIGWRLPDAADWRRLVEAAGGIATAGSKLKSTSGWYNNGNGADTYGFSALPGGSGYFENAGNHGFWWTATEDGSELAYRRRMGYDYNGVGDVAFDKSSAFSARCVRD
jgi:uncharacterized protein (TIGR02145 family)